MGCVDQSEWCCCCWTPPPKKHAHAHHYKKQPWTAATAGATRRRKKTTGTRRRRTMGGRTTTTRRGRRVFVVVVSGVFVSWGLFVCLFVWAGVLALALCFRPATQNTKRQSLHTHTYKLPPPPCPSSRQTHEIHTRNLTPLHLPPSPFHHPPPQVHIHTRKLTPTALHHHSTTPTPPGAPRRPPRALRRHRLAARAAPGAVPGRGRPAHWSLQGRKEGASLMWLLVFHVDGSCLLFMCS